MRKGSDPRWFVVISLLGLLWMYLLLTGPSSFDLLFNPDMGSQLTKGMEILHGRHPFLEVDSGVYGPAIFYLSALGQSLDEQRLLPEIVLIFAGYVLAYAALFSAFKARSHGALLLATFGILAILSLARFHKYHILIGPAVFLLCLHFANDEARPWRTAAVLALGTAIAGLFRLDFGAYCALASIVLLLLKYSSDGTRQTSVSLLVFVGTGFILTSPWLALLVLSGDPVEIIERVFQITWGPTQAYRSRSRHTTSRGHRWRPATATFCSSGPSGWCQSSWRPSWSSDTSAGACVCGATTRTSKPPP